MKPEDLLPDEVNAVARGGLVVRKGTIGAFGENIRILENSVAGSQTHDEAANDLLDLVPALLELKFFDHYAIRSAKVRKIISERYPELSRLMEP